MIFQTHLCVLDIVSKDDIEYLEILRSLVLLGIDIMDKIISVKII